MSKRDAGFPLDENYALRKGCATVELAGWSSVTFTGADRQTFLNNFCTNDVKQLVPGRSCEAFITNVKGKTVGHGRIVCRDDELVLISVPGQAATLIDHLDRYIIREDAQLRDTTADRAYLLLAGSMAAREALAGVSPSFASEASMDRPLPHTAATVDGTLVRWIRWDLLGRPFCGLLEVAPGEVPHVRRLLADHGAVACENAAFDAVRIESGTPLFGVDFDADNLPQEVGRNEQAISFTKGCYLGQETVARIDALGHVNRRLAGVEFAGASVPESGTMLTHAGVEVGRVSSACYSLLLGAPLALAMLRREQAAPGTDLDSPAGRCRVVALPVESAGE